MYKKTGAILLALSVNFSCLANDSNPSKRTETIWDAIKIFEGSTSTVTGDFDCQGMSIGVAQWNIGKSMKSVKSILASIPKDQIYKTMPRYGKPLLNALDGTRDDALAFVRSLQVIERPESCDSKIRNVRWTIEGRAFVKELSSALATESSIKAQRNLRESIFSSGLVNATQWAKSVRGEEASPTLREIAYFVDMQIFNGGGFQKFGLGVKDLESNERATCAKQVLSYLGTADDSFLLHKKAARKNADFLKPEELNQTDRDLFCLSHRVALKLSQNHARQFRLTTINRRAAILFGNAYYSDRDVKPINIDLPSA